MNILLVAVFALPSLLYLLAWASARSQVAPSTRVAAGSFAFDGARSAGQDTGERARRTVSANASATPLTAAPSLRSTMLIAGGLLLHAASIACAMSGLSVGFTREQAGVEPSLHFGFACALSVTFWLGVAIVWIESLRVRVEALQVVVMPVAAVSVLLPLAFPGSDLTRLAGLPLFVPHLLVGTLAYGVLLLAALHAGVMMAAERALHSPSGVPVPSVFANWLDRLPPLLVLERILFRFIWFGFAMLSLTALSGILFSEQIFGQPLRFDHKTVFTLLAWLLFGVLLVGRRRWGWRGRTALRLTLSGFVVLMLAYVGSHFVREVILQRY